MKKNILFFGVICCYLITTASELHADCKGLKKINVVPKKNYTVSLSGSLNIGDNKSNEAVGILLYYSDYYHTKWTVLHPGEKISFRQDNWHYIFAGIPRHNPQKSYRIRGNFILHVRSSDGGTNGNYKIGKNDCTSILE
ncbi:hypothetical protein JWG39_02755 [Desulforhopalus vacuolatus]|uniref:hypothetical protein n=1 Tax=Desulforhopalus vacuolatus TaxID=40414 RepID=UPI001962A402|nr:hypothetical protein [Desulforhopalus vacuolatus]MBM9518738.1 hypothetical protein [Desulforhopalus vacuolatus]